MHLTHRNRWQQASRLNLSDDCSELEADPSRSTRIARTQGPQARRAELGRPAARLFVTFALTSN